MKQAEPDISTDKTISSRQRLRDFVILGTGAIALLGLLMLTGVLSWIEFATASLVMAAGTLAYYVGSQPAQQVMPAAQDSEPTVQILATETKTGIDAFILSMPFAALLIGANGRISEANEYAERILRTEAAKGKLASAVLRQPDLFSAASRVAASGAGELVEFTLHGDTETWMAHMQAGPEKGSAMIVFEDLTAVRRAERARADFLANASHELRTPLTAIGGFIETMRGPAKNDKDSWDGFLEIMQQQTDRMKRLVADLLSLSRIEFGEHRPPDTLVRINGLVQRAHMAMEPIARDAGVTLELEMSSEGVEAIADEDELVQVIQNLVGNAIKYSLPGASIQLKLGTSQSMADAAQSASRTMVHANRAMLLSPRASREVPALWIRVTDSGEGISEEHLPRLGERFYRTDESRGGRIEGTGLGLAIVKHIVSRHRGGFAVESQVGTGSAFSVWMPRVDLDE